MQEKFHTPAILLFVSFNLDLKWAVLKLQPGYEGKENGKEKGNQGIKEHSQIVSNKFVLTIILFRESKNFMHIF